MNDQTVATLVGLAVFIALRVLDAILPKGYHLKWVERFLAKDKDPPNPEDEKG